MQCPVNLVLSIWVLHLKIKDYRSVQDSNPGPGTNCTLTSISHWHLYWHCVLKVQINGKDFGWNVHVAPGYCRRKDMSYNAYKKRKYGCRISEQGLLIRLYNIIPIHSCSVNYSNTYSKKFIADIKKMIGHILAVELINK